MDTWDQLIEAAGRRHNVDPKLIKALMLAESSGNPNAVGQPTQWGRAEGLMQFIPPTARAMGVNPRDPGSAIDGAARLLAENLERYKSPELAILAYHGGTDQGDWGPQTHRHLSRVYGQYSRLASPDAQPPPQGQAEGLDDYMGRRPEVNPQPTDVGGPMPIDEFMGRGDSSFTPVQDRRIAGSRTERLSEGVVRGLRDALDAPAEWIAARAERTGVMEGIRNSPFGRFIDQNVASIPTPEALAETNKAERRAFDETYGDSGYATAGRIAGQVAATVPMLAPLTRPMASVVGATGLPANLLARTAVRGGLGAAEGAAAGYALADPDKPLGEQVGEGAVIGGAMGAVVNPLVGSAYRGARDFFTPTATPERARAAERMGQLGVKIYGPQIISDSPIVGPGFTKRLYGMTEAVPFSGQPERLLRQAQEITRAVSRTFGEDTDAITRDTLRAARTRIGDRMNWVASNSMLVPNADPTVHQRLAALAQAAADSPLETNQARSVARYIEHLADRLRPGQPPISGDEYQAWTRDMSPLAMFLDSNNSTIFSFGRQIKESLDDLLEASSAPGMRQELRDARSQWKAMMTVAPMVAQAPDGVLNAPSLMRAVRSSYDTFKNGGATDNALGDLAEGARMFMGRVFGSDTAFNHKVQSALAQIESLGPLAALSGAGWEAGLVGLGTSAAASGLGRATASTLSANWYRNRIMEKALRQGTAAPTSLGNLGARVAVPGAVSIGAQPDRPPPPEFGVYSFPPDQQ